MLDSRTGPPSGQGTGLWRQTALCRTPSGHATWASVYQMPVTSAHLILPHASSVRWREKAHCALGQDEDLMRYHTREKRHFT